MIVPSKDKRALDIYRQIMIWLEGRGHDSSISFGNALILNFRLSYAAPCAATVDVDPIGTVTESLIRFRRGHGMGGAKWAESLDQEGVLIHYDPNWEALGKIEALLASADEAVAAKAAAEKKAADEAKAKTEKANVG